MVEFNSFENSKDCFFKREKSFAVSELPMYLNQVIARTDYDLHRAEYEDKIVRDFDNEAGLPDIDKSEDII